LRSELAVASIILTSGAKAGEFYPLGRRTTVIGRDEALPVQVIGERVSRKHAQIHYEESDGRYYALDMKSTHGTHVNGRRIQNEFALSEGDEIQIGGVTLLFTLSDFPDQVSAMNHWKQAGQRGKTTMPG
jgi:pSer/pThr/pTyr-binding forkhead associated (FHA) protein